MTTKRMQRNLTIMFTDISGFTRHTEKISRDQLMNRLDTHNKLLMPIVAHFEGKVIKTIGDAFLITFESPTNAVQCGTYMQYTLKKYNQGIPEGDQIHIKVSINAGEVTATDSDVFGDAVNVAAKIEKATNPDEIYFTETVFLAMNKAEVPNAFVKTFRPRGENSQEIKLYKVVQDPADEVYKRIVEQTKIDPEKMKTRIIELSATAEKEYTRYQEALEALMEAQGKSSKTTVIVLAAGVVLLCAVLLIGFFIMRDTGPSPEQVVLTDARTLMANGKPSEARRTLEAWIKEHGESADLKDALELAKLRERQDVGAQAARDFDDLEKEIGLLIAQGKPDVARDKLKAATIGAEFTKRADTLKEQVAHYLSARKAIESGDAQKALDEVKAAFGETDPSDEIKGIREKANAVIRARKLLTGEDARDNGAAVVGILVKAFGENMTGPVLDLLTTAIEHELCALARKAGKDATLKTLQEYRTRFALPGATIKQITREVRLNALWHFTTTHDLKQQVMRTDYGEFGQEMWRMTYQDYPDDATFLWRMGDTLYAISEACYRTPLGFVQWARAYLKDPAIVEKHPEFYDRLMGELHDYQSSGISESMLEEGIKEPIFDARFYIKKFYYQKARPELLKGLTALRKKSGRDAKDERDYTFNANCFAILADKGEAGVVENRFEFFRDILMDETLRNNTLQKEHFKALFSEAMTYEEYKQYRELIDECRRETVGGRYSAYGLAKEMIEHWQTAIREVQPQHTAAFSSEGRRGIPKGAEAEPTRQTGLIFGLQIQEGAEVFAMAADGNELYVGGSFTRAGDKNVTGLAVWCGDRWDYVGGSSESVLRKNEMFPSGETWVKAILVTEKHVYFGGLFAGIGDVISHCIVRWDKKSKRFEGLKTGIQTPGVKALARVGSKLYVACYGPGYIGDGKTDDLTSSNPRLFEALIIWDEELEDWVKVDGVSPSRSDAMAGRTTGPGNANALLSAGSEVYVGGQFMVYTPHTAQTNKVWNNLLRVSQDGKLFRKTETDTHYFGGWVNALAQYDGCLVVGGAGGVTGYGNASGVEGTLGIAIWDGERFKTVGGGLMDWPSNVSENSEVKTLHVEGKLLYVGGCFPGVDGKSSNSFACYDGTRWIEFGSSVHGTVNVITKYQGAIVIAGKITALEGSKVRSLTQ